MKNGGGESCQGEDVHDERKEISYDLSKSQIELNKVSLISVNNNRYVYTVTSITLQVRNINNILNYLKKVIL